MRWHMFVDLSHFLKTFLIWIEELVIWSDFSSLVTIEYQYQGESLWRYRGEINWKLSPVLPRTHSRSCQLLLFFKRFSWNTNRYYPKETVLVAIQYSCQMNGNESIYQVDPGADIEETWETTEIEAELLISYEITIWWLNEANHMHSELYLASALIVTSSQWSTLECIRIVP